MFFTIAGDWSYQNALAVHKFLDTALARSDSKGFLMMIPIDKSAWRDASCHPGEHTGDVKR
jgi:4-hydroxy-L-threonine phosphate dehydrogenase PdxA